MEVLNSLEQGLPHRQPARLVTLQKVVDFIDSGAVKVLFQNSTLPDKMVTVVWEQAPNTNDQAVHHRGKDGQRTKTSTSPTPQSPVPRLIRQRLVRQRSRSDPSHRNWFVAEVCRVKISPESATNRVSGVELQQVLLPGKSNMVRRSSFRGIPSVPGCFTAHLEEHASHRWQLWIEDEHLQRIQGELKASREAQASADRIRRLRERLAKAIRDDRVRVLPTQRTESGKPQEVPHAVLRPLLELLTLPAAADRWIWIDDRYCTGYGSANQTLIATSFEVLRLLEQSGIIDTPKRCELLLKLRKAVQYLPIELEELMHWLTCTTEREGTLVETHELGVLRRSVNSFAAMTKDLRTQPGAHDQGRQPELPGS